MVMILSQEIRRTTYLSTFMKHF